MKLNKCKHPEHEYIYFQDKSVIWCDECGAINWNDRGWYNPKRNSILRLNEINLDK